VGPSGVWVDRSGIVGAVDIFVGDKEFEPCQASVVVRPRSDECVVEEPGDLFGLCGGAGGLKLLDGGVVESNEVVGGAAFSAVGSAGDRPLEGGADVHSGSDGERVVFGWHGL
jgi:hypothetical protein